MLYRPPPSDCPLCSRLALFRRENRALYPAFFNGAVPSFGALDAELLVVGLAPGLKGANQTGRPFTGDYAGLVLYSALRKFKFAEGDYSPEHVRNGIGDNFSLLNCRITNAVRCVPPENKPEPAEIRTCNRFLAEEIAAMPRLKVILTLGQIAHKAVLMAKGMKQASFTFRHGAVHSLAPSTAGIRLINSYHCSRYNINTGVLTQAMFDKVIKAIRNLLG